MSHVACLNYHGHTKPNSPLADRIARLTPAQRTLLEQRVRHSRKAAQPVADRIPRAAIPVSEFPLTSVQRRVWAFEQLCPHTAAYNVIWVKRLEGQVDHAALDHAFNALVARHAVLRSSFHQTSEGPVQRIELAAPAATVTHLSANGEDDARRVALEDAARPFDLGHAPLARASLVRVAAGEHWLLLVVHHLVCDGWSMGILERDLASLYNAFAEGREPEPPPLPLEFSDFAIWNAGREAEGAYWAGELEGAPPMLELPTCFARTAELAPQAWTAAVNIDGALLAALERVAGERGVTLYTLLIAAWAALLHRYGAGDEVMVGSPFAGRGRPELAQVVGFFANTLPLRISLRDDPPFSELLQRAQAKILGALDHQDAAFDIPPAFQTAVAYLESPASALPLTGLRVSHVMLENRSVPFDGMLYADQFSGGVVASVALRKQLFLEPVSKRMASHLLRMLEGIAADPELPVSRYPMMNTGERELMLGKGTGTARPYPREPVHVLFDEQAALRPDRIALVEGGAGCSYGELRQQSDRFAAFVAQSVGPRSVVAVVCRGSVAMVAAFLGVLKAGSAYLPLDPTDPSERRQLLLREAGAALVLDPDVGSPEAPPAPSAEVSMESPAYVMFTSGTTGRPKAVVIPHRGVVRLVKESGFADLGPDEVFLHMAPPAFDASTFEIWAPLLNGGRCVLYSGRRAALSEISDAIRTHGVTTLWLTASLFHTIVDEAPQILAPLRQLLAGGEALSVRHVAKALDALPATRLINGYGPTESTTFACCYAIPRGFDRRRASVPIGAPIGNTQAFVLDAHGEPVPPGVPGELWLGGDGLALGITGLYRTGDRVRWLDSGDLDFLGRADQQLKIRGFRVEPAEVEAALTALPSVAHAAVILRDGMLAAYVVPSQPGFTPEDVRAALAARLPDHMIPRRIVALDRLPLTANGKLDRRALPDPDPMETAPQTAEPSDDLERELLELWRELAGAPLAAVTSDFFAIGGDSLRALRLLVRIEERFGPALPAATIFAAPTVQQFARLLRVPDEDLGFVVITPGSGRPPLVWLDLGGSLGTLAKELGPDQPFYSVTLTPAELAQLSASHQLEDIAARLAEKIERRHRGGPTMIASFCLRSVLAVETARLLRARGHQVPLTVLADPSDPETSRHLLNPATPAALMAPLRPHWRRLRAMPVREWPTYLLGRGKAVAERVKMQVGRNPVKEQPIFAASARHRLEPYDGALLVVRCTRPEDLPRDEVVRSWRRLAAGRLSVRTLPGRHTEMFDAPHVARFAVILREEIDAALRSKAAPR